MTAPRELALDEDGVPILTDAVGADVVAADCEPEPRMLQKCL